MNNGWWKVVFDVLGEQFTEYYATATSSTKPTAASGGTMRGSRSRNISPTEPAGPCRSWHRHALPCATQQGGRQILRRAVLLFGS